MSFDASKITDSDISTYGVQSQPNKLTGSALQNKQAFDKLIAQVVKTKLNALIDELKAITAGAQIGVDVTGLLSTNVQDALAELLAAMQSITQGSVAPGSIGETELASTLEIGSRLVNVLPANVGIKYGTAVPTTSDISDGEIYLKLPEEE
jgi:hypothetical protein